MAQRSTICGLGWNTTSIGISIIAPRISTTPSASAHSTCTSSSLLDARNGFCRRMVPLPNIASYDHFLIQEELHKLSLYIHQKHSFERLFCSLYTLDYL